MKVNIRAHVEFAIDDENDLYTSIQVDFDDMFVEKVKFKDILKRQLRGLSKEEKEDCKNRIAHSVRNFLAELEN